MFRRCCLFLFGTSCDWYANLWVRQVGRIRWLRYYNWREEAEEEEERELCSLLVWGVCFIRSLFARVCVSWVKDPRRLTASQLSQRKLEWWRAERKSRATWFSAVLSKLLKEISVLDLFGDQKNRLCKRSNCRARQYIVVGPWPRFTPHRTSWVLWQIEHHNNRQCTSYHVYVHLPFSGAFFQLPYMWEFEVVLLLQKWCTQVLNDFWCLSYVVCRLLTCIGADP